MQNKITLQPLLIYNYYWNNHFGTNFHINFCYSLKNPIDFKIKRSKSKLKQSTTPPPARDNSWKSTLSCGEKFLELACFQQWLEMHFIIKIIIKIATIIEIITLKKISTTNNYLILLKHKENDGRTYSQTNGQTQINIPHFQWK